MLKNAQAEVARFSGHGSCVLSVGDGLTFRESIDGQIYDVKFDVPTPDFPEFEDSRIVEWHEIPSRGSCSFGFSERQCTRGCRVYCRADDVLTEGTLKLGVWIKHGIETQYDGRIKADRISIYQE
jgi:hypothetical protein